QRTWAAALKRYPGNEVLQAVQKKFLR
ncbi:MAG: hypothetical protein QG572_1378, partial [Pseudomonadota bacterium]|nr:hypothetical protein [Pseudomonadota bacterium]